MALKKKQSRIGTYFNGAARAVKTISLGVWDISCAKDPTLRSRFYKSKNFETAKEISKEARSPEPLTAGPSALIHCAIWFPLAIFVWEPLILLSLTLPIVLVFSNPLPRSNKKIQKIVTRNNREAMKKLAKR